MKYVSIIAVTFTAFFSVLVASSSLRAQEIEDGTYDATVTTRSGTYTVPVEVDNGEVTTVYWPNGGDMSVDGAEIFGEEASGYNSRGDFIDIEIDD